MEDVRRHERAIIFWLDVLNLRNAYHPLGVTQCFESLQMQGERHFDGLPVLESVIPMWVAVMVLESDGYGVRE
jgi:hypothetical protein